MRKKYSKSKILVLLLTLGFLWVNGVSAQEVGHVVMTNNNSLGLTYAENNINKAASLIKRNKPLEAQAVIVPLTEWLSDATEYHAQLFKVLKDIDNAKVQADIEKDLALKFAILRDKASYQAALLYIQEKKLPKAVEKLVDIVRSQPRTELGFSAYERLQTIGFTYKAQMSESTPISDQ